MREVSGAALGACAAVAGLVVLGVAGAGRLAGPVLVDLFGTHGIHLGDVVVVALGAVAVALILRLDRRR